MKSFLLVALAINPNTANANFHYTECGLIKEKRYLKAARKKCI